MEFFHKIPTLHFMRLRRMWYGISLVLVAASIVSLAVRGLTEDNLLVPVEVLSAAQMAELMDQQDVVISF